MSCLDDATLLEVVRDGPVTPAVREHLEACSECSARLTRLETEAGRLREALLAGPDCPPARALMEGEEEHLEHCPACRTAFLLWRNWTEDAGEQRRFEDGVLEGLSAELPEDLKARLASRRDASVGSAPPAAPSSLPKAAMPEDLVHDDEEPDGEDSGT